ncbi:hypothetical protein ACFC1R_37135 [Kitasatospora sp. NPDC056138]|uniref:hypothetical protein n=1 Tax=Kitasatospora sp. NPDC056138 TaxID=3345724 RepID=UPI0035D8E3B6
MDIIRYRGALADLLEEQFGASLPPSHQAAVAVTLLAAELVPADELATFLRVATQAAEAATVSQPASSSYSARFGRLLSQYISGFDTIPGLREAWHLTRILPELLPDAAFGAYVRIAQQALEQSAVAQPGGPRRTCRLTVPAVPASR